MAGLVGATLDHYLLVEQIGQGGMATVYRAEDTTSGTIVAVKVLSPTISGDKRFVRRFRREGGLVSNLDHPNIVSVNDYGEYRGLIYLVMEYIDGNSLHDLMSQRPLTVQETSRWIAQVSDALQSAHDQGVIHRDVKPANILVDNGQQAHLADFGLARMEEGSNTLTGSALLGTPSYMSPEQARGDRLDARSDQYSLGIILYQLNAGRLPFEGQAPMATALMHIQDPVPAPRTFNVQVPEGVEKVIYKALAKDRVDRFDSVAELDQAYQAAVRGDPLTWLTSAQTELGLRPERQPRTKSSSWVGRLGWIIALLLVGAIALGALSLSPFSPFGFLSGGGDNNPEVEETEPPTPLPAAPTEVVVAIDTAIPTLVPEVISADCPGVSLLGFNRNGNTVSWNLSNDSSQTVTVLNIDLPGYPLENPPRKIEFGGEILLEIAAESTLVPGAELTVDLEEALSLDAGLSKQIAIQYTWPDPPTNYALDVVLDAGCTLRATW